MDIFVDYIDDIYVWSVVYDRIGVGGGKGIYIGDTAASHGVVTNTIFVYEEGEGDVGI